MFAIDFRPILTGLHAAGALLRWTGWRGDAIPAQTVVGGKFMRVTLSLVFVLLVAAGCTSAPPDRLVFGVSGERPAGSVGAESDAEMRRFLDWKVSQICTLGYETVKVDTLAAEQDMQIVDQELRCKPYRHVSLF